MNDAVRKYYQDRINILNVRIEEAEDDIEIWKAEIEQHKEEMDEETNADYTEHEQAYMRDVLDGRR